MTITAVKLALESSLEWAELALTINGEDPDPVIRIQPFSQGAPIGWVRSILSSQESIRLPRALLGSIVSLVGVKSDESKAYIALAVDLDNDVEVTITAVDESGGADPGGGGTQARIAGTVMIDGTPASRDIVVISDNPSGRQVIAQGQSAGDGTFDITYNDWAGAVIALALDEYGDEFTTETALNMGQVVHPETPNGYVYQVTAAGTTGTEEPTWSTGGSVTSGSVTFNALPYYRPVASGPLKGALPDSSGSATGGIESIVDIEGEAYRVHVFESDGDLVVSGDVNVEFLIVAGGGAGGSPWQYGASGGGGGGGVVEDSISLTEGTYSVIVGDGGLNPEYTGTPFKGANGGDSSAFGFAAEGGGGGGVYVDDNSAGNNGGSGGGGGGGINGSDMAGGAGASSQGFAGGDGRGGQPHQRAGGGGGGAGATGESTPASGVGGSGGSGKTVDFRGASETLGGGGGGLSLIHI